MVHVDHQINDKFLSLQEIKTKTVEDVKKAAEEATA